MIPSHRVAEVLQRMCEQALRRWEAQRQLQRACERDRDQAVQCMETTQKEWAGLRSRSHSTPLGLQPFGYLQEARIFQQAQEERKALEGFEAQLAQAQKETQTAEHHWIRVQSRKVIVLRFSRVAHACAERKREEALTEEFVGRSPSAACPKTGPR